MPSKALSWHKGETKAVSAEQFSLPPPRCCWATMAVAYHSPPNCHSNLGSLIWCSSRLTSLENGVRMLLIKSTLVCHHWKKEGKEKKKREGKKKKGKNGKGKEGKGKKPMTKFLLYFLNLFLLIGLHLFSLVSCWCSTPALNSTSVCLLASV